MPIDTLDIILGFFEGFALIISPCILPVLPIVLAGSLTGSKQRPFGVTVGFVLTFVLIAFLARQLVMFLHVDFNALRTTSYLLLCFIGLIMLSTHLTECFRRVAAWIIQPFTPNHQTMHREDGFFGGFVFGGLTAMVWTPCAGPILAAVIVQTALQQSTLLSFLTLCTFTIGAAVPMLLIALYGKNLLKHTVLFKKHPVLFRRGLSILILASVAWMTLQNDQLFHSSPVEKTQQIPVATRLQEGLWRPYQAPSIEGIDAWINSKPLSLAALKGQVVLVDFWTYSCINCIRTLPTLQRLYQQYHENGFTVIGVHTPEFDFEKSSENVKQAVLQKGLTYPIALDNQFATWQHFNNHYWPAQYLINREGNVVYTHFGEGNEAVLENNIRYLLKINHLAMAATPLTGESGQADTPETYLGYARSNPAFSPTGLIHNQPTNYHFLNKPLPMNAWELNGSWTVLPDKIIATKAGAAIKIHAKARVIYVVMGNHTKTSIHVSIHQTNPHQSATQTHAVHSISVDKYTLYTALEFAQPTDSVVILTTDAPGLMLYTFTFGS
jgi:cytochrome c biogenesis protein CcdA/thiol-disulfide isomerase/thioredoxin